MPVLYLDIFILINFCISFLIIVLTARFLNIPNRPLFFALSSLGVSVLSILFVFYDFHPFILIPLRLIIAMITVWIAFGIRRVTVFLKTVFYFIVTSLLFGGVVFLLQTTLKMNSVVWIGGSPYFDISPVYLLIFAFLSYIVLYIYDRIQKRQLKVKYVFLHIFLEGKIVKLKCFLDNGANIYEPFSGLGVVIAEKEKILPLFPEETAAIISEYNIETLLALAAKTQYFRAVPIQTANKTSVIPAFKPDKILIKGRKEYSINGYVGISNETIANGDYDGLLSPSLLNL